MEEGPNSGPDGGRMLREVACSAASGDGTDGDGTPGTGASDGTTPTVLRRLVLTSISHLLRLLRLSTTDDTSPGCFGMILSVWSASRMFTVGSNVVAAAVDDGGDTAGSGRFELTADSGDGLSPQSTSVMLAPMDAVVQGPLPANADEDVTGCSLLLVVVAVTGIDIDVMDAPEVHVDGLLT